MDFLAKVVTGHVPDNGPSSSLQICYLNYVNKRMCCTSRMTKIYKMNLAKLDKLFDAATKRYPTLKDKSSTEHEIWHYNILKSVLGKTSPYTSNNTNELTIYEWKLQSSVIDAFIFNKIKFDVVTVILENEMEHWFGIKTSSTPVYTYHRSKPRSRSLFTMECCELPQSPIVLAANNPNYKCKCIDCGECDQIIRPMETYYLKKVCANLANRDNEVETASECLEILQHKKFNLKDLFTKCTLTF